MPWTCSGCSTENPDNAEFCTHCGAPRAVGAADDPSPRKSSPKAAGAPPPPPEPSGAGAPSGVKTEEKRSRAWVWIAAAVLVVALGACVILSGIIAAVALPNLLAAKDRGKQKRTMADMRMAATALQAYQVDEGILPVPGHQGGAYYAVHDLSSLESYLVPLYIQDLPSLDAWGNPIQYGVSEDGEEFVLLSYGSDGESQTEEIPEEAVETACYEDDIIWENDAFVQCPREGSQSHRK